MQIFTKTVTAAVVAVTGEEDEFEKIALKVPRRRCCPVPSAPPMFAFSRQTRTAVYCALPEQLH